MKVRADQREGHAKRQKGVRTPYNPPVAASFHFEHSIPFSPENSAEILRAIPAVPGVFALHGPRVEGQPEAEPYLTRAADLRRRITRILAPPDSQSKRLNLRERVARIDYTVTGSEFESTLTLYHATVSIFSQTEARRRLRLHTPFFLRFTAGNAFPRVYSTNRLSRRALAHTYGPFPSRAAADRYCDAVLDLFKLRRCHEDLAPYPEHPGCVYGEMNKCLAPCNQACTPEGAAAYAAEATAVESFFATHGESLLTQLTAEREQASTGLDFERAAQLHAQFLRVNSAAALADPLVQPIPNLRAVILQKSAQPALFLSSRSAAEGSASPEPSAALFLFDAANGDAIYRHASFFAGMLGERVAGENVTVIDDGTLVFDRESAHDGSIKTGGFGTAPFDGEGLPTRRTVLVENGILRSYVTNTYTARKLGLATSTGNAARSLAGNPGIGAGNFFLEPGTLTPAQIIADVKSGLYVTETMGFGVNLVTGDYSQGAAGMWIENGELAYPVEEITIAGNLKEMYKNISAIGNDLVFRTATAAPTLRIDGMTIAGS